MAHRRYRFLLIIFIGTVSNGQSVRIKDLVNIRGNRSNQLIGLGLVIGLSGTGDSKKSTSTNQAIASLFTRLGLFAESKTVVNGSAAAVIVTGELAPFSKNGDRIDVKISTVGDATSLQGGTLVQTPLRAGDGKIYAVAQGSIFMGMGSGNQADTQTTSFVYGGAFVEREFIPNISDGHTIDLSLKRSDFTNNHRITNRINQHFKGYFAESVDPGHIKVSIPPGFQRKIIAFVAELEGLKVESDLRAVVVLNEKTGTLVMGNSVQISPIVIAHGDVSIQIGSDNKNKVGKSLAVEGTTVGDLIRGLNSLGIKPHAAVNILQAIQRAGALKGELEIM